MRVKFMGLARPAYNKHGESFCGVSMRNYDFSHISQFQLMHMPLIIQHDTMSHHTVHTHVHTCIYRLYKIHIRNPRHVMIWIAPPCVLCWTFAGCTPSTVPFADAPAVATLCFCSTARPKLSTMWSRVRDRCDMLHKGFSTSSTYLSLSSCDQFTKSRDSALKHTLES